MAKSKAVQSHSATAQETEPYYIFNASEDKGFVIVSGDDRAKKILGYSDKGSFDCDNLPPQLKDLLGQYAKQIESLPESAPTDLSWTETSTSFSNESGSVLLETANWGQGYPYNAKCPVIDGFQCPTGCVATAMAIVMKYHNWPNQGRYKWTNTYDNNLFVDFSESHYNFSTFKDSYDDTEDLTPDVLNMAKLCYDAGMAVNMLYNNESGAQVTLPGYAMTRFFKYSPDCHFHTKLDFTDKEWNDELKENLNLGLPVIYGANNETTGGHEFIIDGYNEDYFHINWGWYGELNGYFKLSALAPDNNDEFSYDSNHTMISHIKPDYQEQTLSEIWVDCGNDRGHFWQPEWVQQSTRGYGMIISCEEVQTDVPFTIMVHQINIPTKFIGELAIAVMNKNNDIVEILRTQDIQMINPNFEFPYYPYYNVDAWKDLIYHGPTSNDLYLQLISREIGNDNWRIVNGTEHTPTRLSFKGNEPMIVTPFITYHGIDESTKDLVDFTVDTSRVGQGITFGCKCTWGVARVYVDDQFQFAVSDFHSKHREEEGFGSPHTKTSCKIDIYYTPQNELISKTIHVSAPGTLSNLITDEDKYNLYRLKLTGLLNNDDIKSLNSLYCLGELDMEESSIEGNVLTVWLPYLRVLTLPKWLKKLYPEDTLHPTYTGIVNIPSEVTDCGYFRPESFVVFNSPEPPSSMFSSIPSYFDGINSLGFVIIVPKGSRGAYAQHPYWKYASEIIEMDKDDYFDGSFKIGEDAMYCNITKNYASIILNHKMSDIVSAIIEDPQRPWDKGFYPYRYFKIPSSIDGKSIQFFREMYAYSTLTYNDCRKLYYIPSDSFLTFLPTKINDEYNYYYPGFIISPCLEPNFAGCFACVLVPAHSNTCEELDKEDQYGNFNYERHEMFGMNCNKKGNTVNIYPDLYGVHIERVFINGLECFSDNCLYKADFSNDVEIKVVYNYLGFDTMTTEYTADFIASLPDSQDYSDGVDDIFADNRERVEVFSLSGIFIKNVSTREELNTLQPGMYVLRSGNKTEKVLIQFIQ